MLLRRTVGPTSWPVSLDDARMHLRVTDAGEDFLIEALIRSACDLVGEMSGRVLSQETWVASYDSATGDIVLPKNPVIGVTSIGYFDANDAVQTATLGDFHVFLSPDQTIVRPKTGKAWPTTSRREDAISITFTAGYTALPDALRAAILLTVGHLFENRQSVVTGTIVAALPMAVESLVGVHRLGWAAG